MFIYEGNELMYLPGSIRWYLHTRQDIPGTAYIYLHVAGEDYPLWHSGDLNADYPDVDGDDILELYEAMVREVARRMNLGQVNCIDLPAMQAELLPYFLPLWYERGYLGGDLN